MVVIREEQPSDFPAIRKVVTAAFDRPDEADLVDRLRADGDIILSLVAVAHDTVLGHVLFSRMAAPFRALGLAPVSVRPDRQGTGIGSRLIHAGLKRVKAEGWEGVFVLGDPAYYRRFGFEPALASAFVSPYAGPHLMAHGLGTQLPVKSGRIDYAPAFAAVG